MAERQPNRRLRERFDEVDQKLGRLEGSLSDNPRLEDTLPESLGAARELLDAYAEHAGKAMPVTDDPLIAFKAFVKGDPSLNAVRDNLRELVYYRNCIEKGRRDALPDAAERMAVRTARHVYLYLRSRCEQERRFD